MLASRGIAAAETLEGERSSFALLDEIVQGPAEHGVLNVVVRREAMVALARHVARRAEVAGRPVHVVGHTPVADVWRELALCLRAFDTCEPTPLGRRIARAAVGCVLVIAERQPTSWGRIVAEEVARQALDPDLRLLVVRLEPPSHAHWLPQPMPGVQGTSWCRTQAEGPRHERLEIDALGSSDGRRWWEAVVARDELLAGPPLDTLESLDAFWEGTRARPSTGPLTPDLSAGASDLWDYALRAEQTLTPAQADALSGEQAREELVHKGLLVPDPAGRLRARDGIACLGLHDPERDRQLARVLVDA